MFEKGREKTGGRQKGSKDKKTVEKELQKKLYENYLLEKILEEKEDTIVALLSEAKKGNVQAIKEIHERILGKVKEEVEHSGEIKTPITKIIVNTPE